MMFKLARDIKADTHKALESDKDAIFDQQK